MKTETIDEVKYPYIFGISVIKRMAQDRGVEKVEDAITLFSQIDYDHPTGADLDTLSSLFFYAFERGSERAQIDFELSQDDVLDYLYTNTDAMARMMDEFVLSIGSQKVDESGNSKAPRKKGQPEKA